MVHALNPLEDRRWEAFVARHPRASAFHTVAWLRALERSYGYEPVVLTTAAPNEQLADGLLFCRVRSFLTGRRLVSVPFADHCEPLLPLAADSQVLAALPAEAARWRYLELRPRSAAWHAFHAPHAFVSASFRLHELDLRPDLDDVFDRFHRSTVQRRIRRAEREGLTCETGTAEHLQEAFYRLLLLTRRRHGIPPQPRHWFSNLCHAFGENLEITVAWKDGRPVASVVTLRHGSTLVYKYGCSDAVFHHLGAMPFVFWTTIQRAKREKIEVFDLGRTDLDNPGLALFKERLGAESSSLDYVRYSADPAREGRPRLSVPRGLIARLPDALFVTAGRFLYRHAG